MSNMNCMINKHIQHYWNIKSHYSRYTTSIIQLLKYYEIDFHFMDPANQSKNNWDHPKLKRTKIYNIIVLCFITYWPAQLKIADFPQWQTPGSWPLHMYCYLPMPDANIHQFPSVRPNYF